MKHMSSYLVCAFAAVLVSTASLRAAPPIPDPASSDGPRIKFDNDIFQAGKVMAGKPLAHTFIFTNIGNKTLEVTKVNPTCGCTVAGTWTKSVEPGKTGTIPIVVNVNQAWSGDMMKTLTVESNDKSKPGAASISIKFHVWKPVELSEPYVFMNVPPETESEVSRMVRIKNNADEPLAVYDAKSTIPEIGVEIITNSAGKSYELKVSAKPPFKQGHNPSAQISVKTSSTNAPTLMLGATANIASIVSLNPPHIVLASEITNAFETSVDISYGGANPFKVSNPAINAKGVDLKLTETAPGKSYRVTLTFPPGFDAGGRPMELTLDSTSPQLPVIKVTINQIPQRHAGGPIKRAAFTPSAQANTH